MIKRWFLVSMLALAATLAGAKTNPVFAHNPLVTSGAVGSYIGAPLVTPAGNVLGTLCLIGSGPNDMTSGQVDGLGELAKQVAEREKRL